MGNPKRQRGRPSGQRGSPLRGRIAAVTLLGALACASLFGCAASAPLAQAPPLDTSGAPAPLTEAGFGDLIVYSATFAPTLEEGEYPAHTDYTVATPADKPLQHITNQTGSFDKRPATVSLASGEYHVRAQYQRGGFITVPVTIEAGKTTILDLDGTPASRGPSDPIRLPDGTVAGWSSTRPKP